MSDVLHGVGTINVGLSTFADALRAQGAPVVEVDWRPPAGGDPRALELLKRDRSSLARVRRNPAVLLDLLLSAA